MKSNEKEIKWWFFCETKQTNKKIGGKRFLREKEKKETVGIVGLNQDTLVIKMDAFIRGERLSDFFFCMHVCTCIHTHTHLTPTPHDDTHTLTRKATWNAVRSQVTYL